MIIQNIVWITIQLSRDVTKSESMRFWTQGANFWSLSTEKLQHLDRIEYGIYHGNSSLKM